MNTQRVLAGLLILVGCAGLGSVSVSTAGSNIVVFATIFVALISLGLIATGVSWIFDQRVRRDVRGRIPAGTLVLVGLTCIVGGLIFFRPWRATITQGFRVGLTAGVGLVGAGVTFGGWRWGRERQMRYPLGLLTGGVVLGGSYILHQALDIDVAPLFMALIGLVALLVTVSVAYLAPARSSISTSD